MQSHGRGTRFTSSKKVEPSDEEVVEARYWRGGEKRIRSFKYDSFTSHSEKSDEAQEREEWSPLAKAAGDHGT